jgi:hypothetical protein
MALGIEQNNLAPQLIQNSGAALVQGIRQIGQQISGHLTELQTKRDLAAMGQELQGLNVQSNEFPVQLTQMLSRHPLAARDERGQMALSILGKAHGQWQAGEAEARAFNRAMAMQGARDRSARNLYDYKRKTELETPQNVGGALVVPQDPVTGQPNVLLPAPARAGTGPKTLSPGAVLVDPTGKVLAENPASAKPMNEYQTQTMQLRKRDELRKVYKSKADTWDKDIRELEESIRAVDKEEREEGEKFRPARAVERLEWQKKLLATKELRDAALQEMSKIDSAPVEPELGPVPAGAAAPAGVLPAPGAVAAPGAPSDLPVMTPAQAANLPSGTQFKGTNGRIYTTP